MLVGSVLVVACEERAGWLRVERVEPAASEDGHRTVFVNQDVVVHFSAPLDPASVTRNAVRIVDEHGQRLDGQLLVGSRSVRFRPTPPATAELDDGTFHPGQQLRLEIPGMPTSYGVRSLDGLVLERGLVVPLSVAEDPSRFGLPSPFLPIDSGAEPFTLDVPDGRLPRLAAGDRTLDLHFTVPPLPSTVRPEAFEVFRLEWGRDVPPRLIPESARILPQQTPGTRHFGCTARLQFPEAVQFAPGDNVYLTFAIGADALRDYRGRPIAPLGPLAVRVDPGDRVRLLEPELGALRLTRNDDAPLGMEVLGGRIRGRARVEAGSGAHGALDLAAGVREIGLTGATVERQLRSLHVARGAELRIRAGDGVLLRCVGDVVVDGRLVLLDAWRELPWRTGDAPDVESLLRASGVAIVAGGEISIAGEVVAEGEPRGSPLTLVTGADLRIDGRLPPHVVAGLEPGRELHGLATALTRLALRLTPGLPPGVQMQAAARTEWLPLPERFSGRIGASLEDATDGMEAWLQIARPLTLVDGVPRFDPSAASAPVALPLRDPLEVRPGAYVRVVLAGVVRGEHSPSLRGFRVVEQR